MRTRMSYSGLTGRASPYPLPTITYKGRRIRLTQRMFDILDYATRYPKPGTWQNMAWMKRARKPWRGSKPRAWSRLRSTRTNIH